MMINWLAVFVAGISAFVLGGIWYSPRLFGNAWMIDNKLTMEDIRKGNFGKIYGWAFILSLIASVNLAMFLAPVPDTCPAECAQQIGMGSGAMYGALAGLWVFCFVAIHGLFEHKPARLIFINGGYALAALALMGAIIGLWR
jgi:hypothetical protein